MKQCYQIVWKVERKQTVKTWWFQKKKKEKPMLLSK